MRVLLWAAGPVLAGWVLAGLVARRRLCHAYLLPPFLVALIVSAALPVVNPRGYDWTAWLIKETVHTVLAFALGLELAVRLFRNLPGAALVARGTVLAVLAGTAALVASAPWQQGVVADLSVIVLPRVIVGLAWLYFGVAMTTAFFTLPEDRLHRAVLATFPFYFMLYAVVSTEIASDGVRRIADYGLPLALVAVLAVMSYAAWAREREPDAPVSLMQVLWPWR